MQPEDDFENAASRERDPGVAREFLGFLVETKKWFLWPIFLFVLLLCALAFLSSTSAAPFIYSLF